MKDKKVQFWKRGQQKQLADTMGISSSHLCDILHRRRSIGKEKAKALSAACSLMFRKDISAHDWLYNDTSTHPAFYGSPLKD